MSLNVRNLTLLSGCGLAFVWAHIVIATPVYADEKAELQAIQANVEKIKEYGNSATVASDSSKAYGVLRQLKDWMVKYCHHELREQKDERRLGDEVCADAQYQEVHKIVELVQKKLISIASEEAVLKGNKESKII